VCALYSRSVNHCPVNVCVLASSANVSQHELQQQRHLLGTAGIVFVSSPSSLLSMQVNVRVTHNTCTKTDHLFL